MQDGTLLDSRSRVLPSSVAAIKAALARGITVFLATGGATAWLPASRASLPPGRCCSARPCCVECVLVLMPQLALVALVVLQLQLLALLPLPS